MSSCDIFVLLDKILYLHHTAHHLVQVSWAHRSLGQTTGAQCTSTQQGFLESTFLSCATESYNLLLTRVEAAVDTLNLFLLNLVRFCGTAKKSRL